MVKVHREPLTPGFLGIKNENWQAAARDLDAHALKFYLYLAANANNFTLALSPAAVQQDIGMPRSTYHDQFHKLVDKGYLVHSHGNTYEFYEVPQGAAQTRNNLLDAGQGNENCPADDSHVCSDGHDVLSEDIEINNKRYSLNTTGINN